MNRERFISELETTDNNINNEQLFNVLKRSIDCNLKDGNPRGHRNLIIVMEELAELAQAVSKELRGKCDHYNLLEELADVQLCIYYVQEICNISDDDLSKAMNVKLNRLDEVLSKRGEYQ